MSEFVLEVCKKIFPILSPFESGELFIEDLKTTNISLQDSKIQQKFSSSNWGMSLRIFKDINYFMSSNEKNLKAFNYFYKFKKSTDIWNPNGFITGSVYFPSKIENFDIITEELKKIDESIRFKNVKNCIVRFKFQLQEVWILKPDGKLINDIRPLYSLSIIAVLEDKNIGVSWMSRAMDWEIFDRKSDELKKQIDIYRQSRIGPKGVMPVLLGNGSTGVLLHEAIGHGVEGDFNVKGISAFHNLISKVISHKEVNIFDDGTIANHGGSLNFDDQGIPSKKTQIMKDGRLISYLHDEVSATKSKIQTTGNGRRESYAHLTMPRMRTTYIAPGTSEPNEMINSIKKGVYVKTLGGGQVNITSGQFAFNCSEAYNIENGKITYPIKDLVVSGIGINVLKNIKEVGKDFKLCDGSFYCGKNGQIVPVGVGQPSLLVSNMLVGTI